MKRILAASAVFLALALAGTDAHAQYGSARGKVVDEAGNPLPDAKILMDFQGGVTRQYTVKSDKKGEFTQMVPQSGNYKFTITKDGYQGAFFEFRIGLGEATTIPDIKLVSAKAAAAASGAGAAAEKQKAFDAALELWKGEKFDEAIAALNALIEKDPTFTPFYFYLGHSHAAKKEYDQAEAAFKKALEIKPEFVEVRQALADIYQRTDRAALAVEILKGAAESGDAKALFALGVTHHNANRSQEAYDAFKKAEELDPSMEETSYFLGTVAVSLGKKDEAIANLEKYLAKNPKNAQYVATAQGLLGYLKPKK